MSESPSTPARPVGPIELAAIERAARERCRYSTAQLRAAIAVGCDPDLVLTVTQLCELTFKDLTLSGTAVSVAASGNSRDAIEIAARPGDPACPVAALRSLREAARDRMRAERGGTFPSDTQLEAQRLFINRRSGAPLTPRGLRRIVKKACAGLQGVVPAARGRLAALSLQQRRQVIAAGSDPKTARNLALLFHTALCGAQAGDVRDFSVEDVAVWGADIDGATLTPLVDCIAADGTVTTGILNRVGSITDTDILDTEGTSLYGSGLIMGVGATIAHATRTQDSLQAWYRAQPGSSACPVRLLLMWLKCYDRLLMATTATRLAGHHPLFTSLRRLGEPIKTMTSTLGRIIREAMSSIGIPPHHYNAHSLRKFRATAALERGGSMPDVMLHDGR